MLFRSRQELTHTQRFRVWLWPRRSWRRSTTYMVKRALRVRATPHAVAAGVAAGVFAAITPFLGFHFIIAALLAYAIGGNVVAALIGTSAGNPLTYPFIWLGTFQFGTVLIGGADRRVAAPELGEGFVRNSIEAAAPTLLPMAAGSVPLGLAVAAITYLAVRHGVQVYQAARQ